MIFDLHTHTKRSHDAFTSESELLHACCKRGIGAIAITEHDVVPKLNRKPFEESGIHVFFGCEYTTNEGVHIIGIYKELSKITESNQSREQIIQSVKSNGGLLIMPHPLKERTGYLAKYGVDDYVSLFDFIELYNGGDIKNNGAEITLAVSTEKGVRLIGSSDSHAVNQIGICVTSISDIERSYSADQVFEALKKSGQDKISILIDESVYRKDLRKVSAYKKTLPYQFALKVVPSGLRRRLKIFLNWLLNRRPNLPVPSWKRCY